MATADCTQDKHEELVCGTVCVAAYLLAVSVAVSVAVAMQLIPVCVSTVSVVVQLLQQCFGHVVYLLHVLLPSASG